MVETNNIEQLMDLLPNGYEEQCYEKKAIERNRIIKNAKDLMKLCMIYLTQACSLMDISAYARLLGIGKLSDVAFMKRFSKCNEWFMWIINKIRPGIIISYTKPKKLEAYTIVALDASDVTEKGATKRIWRFHYAIDIFKMQSLEYKLTDEKTGESLTNFKIKPEYLILGDRAYGTKRSIEHCIAGKGNYILRIRSKAFKLYDEEKKEINLLRQLKKVTIEKGTEIEAYMENSSKQLVKLRVCFIKKTAEEIEKSRRKINRRDSKKGITTSEESKEMNDYIVVITSLPEDITTDEILSLYRLRWQVELYFKRLKSIMNFGDCPKKKEESIMTWLNGKLMVALLIEKAMATAVSFSPSIQM